ncbi:hypothetical protein [Acinetobacter soli]|uniref:hypothetical protein n=1 Tax=Acinetobacter soli TaxID=487316 RepID=UPI00125FD61E|nr:hypothetical protein [Acinetobacter soli]
MADSDYAQFFLNSKRSIYRIECVELMHPSFSKVYRITPSDDDGVTVKHNASSDAFFYEYLHASIERSGVMGDLDQSITVTIAGLGDVLPDEFDRIANGEFTKEKPIINYRLYSSDNLNKPEFELLGLQLNGVAEKDNQAVFKGEAPRLNTAKTGEIYSLDENDCPDLRGAL